jgi:hypothetical protein
MFRHLSINALHLPPCCVHRAGAGESEALPWRSKMKAYASQHSYICRAFVRCSLSSFTKLKFPVLVFRASYAYR